MYNEICTSNTLNLSIQLKSLLRADYTRQNSPSKTGFGWLGLGKGSGVVRAFVNADSIEDSVLRAYYSLANTKFDEQSLK